MQFDTTEAQNTLREHYAVLLGEPSRAVEFEEAVDRIQNIERAWNQAEEAALGSTPLPETARAFGAWYDLQCRSFQEATQDFVSYLRDRATLDEVGLYLHMENLVDGSFDDIIALAQVGLSGEPKLAMARNYWDEMGAGDVRKMHTRTFADSIAYLERVARPRSVGESFPVECLMNGNLISMWALRRRYALRLYGAIGLIEGTASARFAAVTQALARYEVPEAAICYHRQHIDVDAQHGREWLELVLLPYAERGATPLREICLGVLIRRRIALAYYARVQNELKRETGGAGAR